MHLLSDNEINNVISLVSGSATDSDCRVEEPHSLMTSQSRPAVTSQPRPLLTSESGAVSSLLSPTACPWTIHVAPHQRLNVTLVDFSVAVTEEGWQGGDREQAGRRLGEQGGKGGLGGVEERCRQYAVIAEPTGRYW